MPMVGGDLGAMAALARRFACAGEEFHVRADELTRAVAAALDELTTEMAALDGEARRLGEEIDQQVVGLRAQADGTVWTGRHRAEQDHAIATLEEEVHGVRSAIDAFVTESSGIVRGALATTMTAMQTDVRAAGIGARAVAESFASGVEQQRAAFDVVLNG